MDVQGKKVTVLGAARSGIAAALLLKGKGARVFVSDSAEAERKAMEQDVLLEEGIEAEFGGHSERIYNADFVVLSPGIPAASTVVRRFYEKDIPVYSEVEVAGWYNRGKIIGVTGSNGKTTTTTLIGEMLRRSDPGAIVAGNIGSALSEHVANSKPGRWGVVELSSFQLETIDTLHCDLAVVLNFAPNHLDRYESYEDYIEAKWRITKNLRTGDRLIYNADDELLSQKAQTVKGYSLSFSTKGINPPGAGLHEQGLYLFGQKLIDLKDIKLNGIHNYMNVMAAVLAAHYAAVSASDMCHVLQSFAGVEHRLEHVAEKDGILFINDSKATTVESMSYALQSFERPIVLIAGGKDKGSDFSKLLPLLKKHVRQAILIGTAADKMQQAWQGSLSMQKAESMEDAMEKATGAARKGDVILLSPACASFDMFKDYEERGRVFKALVKERTQDASR